MGLADWQKQHEANARFVEKLKAGRFAPDADQGVVTLVVQAPSRDDGVAPEEDRPATSEELEELGFVKGYVDAHPEGADRGGYVPFVFGPDGATATWDECDGEWRAGG